MGKAVQEVSLDIVHFLAGFSDEIPEGVTEFLELRSSASELKVSIDPSSLEGCTKSKAKKGDWIKAFVGLDPLKRRVLVMRNPMIVPLLPRDLKTLGVKECKPCGTKSFNPGRQTTFNVYGVFDVMSALTPAKEAA